MALHPIILCGGPGARLWPASNQTAPKPFLDLVGGPSLFQRTVSRLAAIPEAARPVIIAGRDHVGLVRRQLAQIGAVGVVLAEPAGRDSAAAILAAALWIANEDPTGLAMAVASDHHIPDVTAFVDAVALAMGAAEAGRLVTFGVKPRSVSSAYGYIRPGPPLSSGAPAREVVAFLEKPDKERARRLIDDGAVWNSGNFLFRVDSVIGEAMRFCPEIVDAVRAALAEGRDEPDAFRLGPGFNDAPRMPFDIAVMERTDRAAVLEIDYPWSDLGAWDEVWAVSEHDAQGNAIRGAAVARDSQDCLLRAGPGVKIIALGVRNLAVVAESGQVLVSDLAAVGGLKPALEALKALPAAAAGTQTLAGVARRLRDWLFETALPVWWCLDADHRSGGFWAFSVAESASERQTGDLARQAGLTQAFARAGQLGWPGPWRTALDHGLDHVIGRLRTGENLSDAHGLTARPESRDVDAVRDQAAVVQALSLAAAVTPHRAADLAAMAHGLVTDSRRASAVATDPRAGGLEAHPDAWPVGDGEPMASLSELRRALAGRSLSEGETGAAVVVAAALTLAEVLTADSRGAWRAYPAGVSFTIAALVVADRI